MQNQLKVVGLVMLGGQTPEPRLLEWLAAKLMVGFVNRNPGDFDGLDGVVFLARSLEDVAKNASSRIPSLIMLSVQDSKPGRRKVTFTNSKLTPSVFRSRNVPQEIACGSHIPVDAGDEALAAVDGVPVWIARSGGSCRRDTTVIAPPQSDPSQTAKDSFHPRNFAALLPLVDFLRRLSGQSEWCPPPVRACFMFDDPNLHARRYGWLNYREITQHATEHNYHVTFATVPLDGWYANRNAAAFFRGQHPRLSLLIHGNDHLHEELSSFESETQAVSALVQALRRIERLEQATGIQVSRVMAPPHGTCSELTLQVMAQLGFEAVCTTLSWLAVRNVDASWVKRLGLSISEVVAGSQVIARFRLDSMPHNSALLAAYLGQPIVLYGHHQEVADGINVLDDLADYTNSVGEVQWMNMSGISRTNYQTRRQNGLLEVRSYARLFEIVIPAEVETLSVQRAWLGASASETLRIKIDGVVRLLPNYAGEPFAVVPGARLEVQSVHPAAIEASSVHMPKPNALAFFRRQISSFRDRLQPATQFLSARNGKKTVSG